MAFTKPASIAAACAAALMAAQPSLAQAFTVELGEGRAAALSELGAGYTLRITGLSDQAAPGLAAYEIERPNAGAPIGLEAADIDGDGRAEVIVRTDAPGAGGDTSAEAYALFDTFAHLVSRAPGIPAEAAAPRELRRTMQVRFGVGSGRRALEMLDEVVGRVANGETIDRETAVLGAPNAVYAAEGALLLQYYLAARANYRLAQTTDDESQRIETTVALSAAAYEWGDFLDSWRQVD